ncbi:MAG: hypothetical protein ALECFALPRED_008879 [Alectoria fallacina]|uniref:ER lumen protein-retaining receptor n=1 Tax=Alectoria fallacina TaxID=1903189 RepID=A0A8H3J4X0_9LECA|nr:MAG: hypothetical protein ALECFALPRED_008879 [Alectoria fallacina]
MNVFRILGDLSHTASKCILIWAIHANQSAEGVSLITQLLYVGVFITRYLDLFWTSPFGSIWNFSLKIFYILSSLYIIFLMMQVYARTREREKAWRLGAYCLGGSVLLAPIATIIAQKKDFFEMLWTFSIILESVCVIPQLLLLRQTTVPTVIDSFYLLTLGSYRAFYILNWIVRLASSEHHFEWRAVLFGIIQTAFYVDFAWVYWTRQRVKLRNGGVVDSDDLSRGFLVSRVLGRGDTSMDDEERGPVDGVRNNGSAGVATKKGSNWGTRSISVSADEDVMDQTQQPGRKLQSKGFC